MLQRQPGPAAHGWAASASESVAPSRRSQLEQQYAQTVASWIRERAEVGAGADRDGRAGGKLDDLGDLQCAGLGRAGPGRGLAAQGDLAPVDEERCRWKSRWQRRGPSGGVLGTRRGRGR